MERLLGVCFLPLLIAMASSLASCGEEAEPAAGTVGADGVVAKSSAGVRATRRAYDGAPPVIAHDALGAACETCHDATGRPVSGIGYAPPSPHSADHGAMGRCEQCHVYAQTGAVFVNSAFTGLAQDLRKGSRQHGDAPPVIPHQVQLRENCTACHTGPAAREEIRCSHPERARCQQCHVEVVTTGVFERSR